MEVDVPLTPHLPRECRRCQFEQAFDFEEAHQGQMHAASDAVATASPGFGGGYGRHDTVEPVTHETLTGAPVTNCTVSHDVRQISTDTTRRFRARGPSRCRRFLSWSLRGVNGALRPLDRA